MQCLKSPIVTDSQVTIIVVHLRAWPHVAISSWNMGWNGGSGSNGSYTCPSYKEVGGVS